MTVSGQAAQEPGHQAPGLAASGGTRPACADPAHGEDHLGRLGGLLDSFAAPQRPYRPGHVACCGGHVALDVVDYSAALSEAVAMSAQSRERAGVATCSQLRDMWALVVALAASPSLSRRNLDATRTTLTLLDSEAARRPGLGPCADVLRVGAELVAQPVVHAYHPMLRRTRPDHAYLDDDSMNRWLHLMLPLTMSSQRARGLHNIHACARTELERLLSNGCVHVPGAPGPDELETGLAASYVQVRAVDAELHHWAEAVADSLAAVNIAGDLAGEQGGLSDLVASLSAVRYAAAALTDLVKDPTADPALRGGAGMSPVRGLQRSSEYLGTTPAPRVPVLT